MLNSCHKAKATIFVDKGTEAYGNNATQIFNVPWMRFIGLCVKVGPEK